MTENGNLIEFPEPERIKCPTCGDHNVRTTLETETFSYGDGPEAVELTVRIPVRTCDSCGFQFTDDIAEEARHEAVCRHLGMMSPKEIQRIRKAYGMSRADFARLTRIGEASLARWESGQLIQSSAYDHFLYLLSFPENLERLKSRRSGEQPLSSRQLQHRARLRALEITEPILADAAAFELIPTGT
jgi:putative zinc finger/helix-turn-helix YgiT family protein